MRPMLKTILIIAGSLLIADTLFVRMLSNGNLGTYLPAILGLPLLLAGIFFAPLCAGLANTAGLFIKIAAAAYAALILFFCVMSGIILGAATTPVQSADVIVVLGCAVRGDRISLTLKYRLDTANDSMQRFPDAYVIVTGGQGPGEDLSEAQAMYDYLVSCGADASRIIMEDQAKSTYENFLYSKEIIAQHGGTDIAFVTTGFHVFRAERVARSLGLEASGIAAPDIWYTAPNNLLRECIAIISYAISGRL